MSCSDTTPAPNMAGTNSYLATVRRTDRTRPLPEIPRRLKWPVSEHFQLQSARSRTPRDDCRLCHTVLAATNKCLAQSNKSPDCNGE